MQAQWKRNAFRNASRSIVRTRAFWRPATPLCTKWSIKMSIRDVILPIKRLPVPLLTTIAYSAFYTNTAASETIRPLSSIRLYQFAPCPYCCKVRAILDYYKVPYEIVEVNPVTKKELKDITTYRKVPVCQIEGDIVTGSSVIVNQIASRVRSQTGTIDGTETEWCHWVDTILIPLLPLNIYRSFSEACDAFEYCLTEGNFTPLERQVSKYFGAIVMYGVSKRKKKTKGIQEERQALYDAVNEWIRALDDHAFLGGDTPNLADLSVFGVLRSIQSLATFEDLKRNTSIVPWYDRMRDVVGSSAGRPAVST